MSFESNEVKIKPMQPRFFWRRSLAFFIDFSLIAILFTLFVATVQQFVSVPLIAPSAFNFRYCVDATESPQALLAVQSMKLQSDETLSIRRCSVSNMGLLHYNVLSISAVKVQGATKLQRGIFYPVNEKNEFTKKFDTSPFLWLIIPAIFAVFTYRLGQTPGKRLVKLKVVTTSDKAFKLENLLVREYLRLGIPVAFGVISITKFVFSKSASSPDELARLSMELSASPRGVLFATAWVLLPLVPYLYSLVRWRGEMFYDKLAGFIVKKI